MQKLPEIERTDMKADKPNYLSVLFQLATYKFAAGFLRPDDHGADVGCGLGDGTALLSYYAHVSGYDADSEVISKACKRHQNRRMELFEKATPMYLHEQDFLKADKMSYSFITCIDVIEHLVKSDGDKLVGKFAEFLTEDGVAIISTPRRDSVQTLRRAYKHKHEYSYDEFRALLEKYFKRVAIFTRNDTEIHFGHPYNAWAFIAVCYGPRKKVSQ